MKDFTRLTVLTEHGEHDGAEVPITARAVERQPALSSPRGAAPEPSRQTSGCFTTKGLELSANRRTAEREQTACLADHQAV